MNVFELILNDDSSKKLIYKLIDDMIPVIENLHNNNIVHRDIKPENIMYDKKNFILIDLGLACINQCNFLAGTKDYILPNILYNPNSDIEEYKKSDIYAFGITCYQLANRKLHFYNSINNPYIPS